MTVPPIRFGATTLTVLASLAFAGCGGDALVEQDGGTGPLAACGHDCTTAQVTSSCSSTCARIAQAGCSAGAGDCLMSCTAATTSQPSCGAVADDFLRCVESSQPTCPDGGIVQFSGCDPEGQALDDCINDAGSPGTAVTPGGPSTGTGCTAPASVCPNIPSPRAATACSGGGGASAGGPATFMTSCQDGSGNVWQSECTASSCTCTYNGASACTCMVTAACASCCPGSS